MSGPRSPSRPGFAALAARTRARLAVGRTGPRLGWSTRAALILDEATANDATLEEVPRSVVSRMKLTELGTHATSRQDALRNPASARRLDAHARARLKRCRQRPDVQVVVCDGLAPAAITRHGRALLAELARLLRAPRYRMGTPIFVRNGRTAVYHEITRAVRPRALCLVVGQRPSAQTPSALTAHMLPGRPSDVAVIVRDIHAGDVTPRAAARALVDALGTLLGDIPPAAPSRRRGR